MKAVDGKTMQSIDRRAVLRFGLKTIQLMENAGRAVADTVRTEYQSCARRGCRVAVIAGKGNNGGDGYVAARHIKNSGIAVAVFSLARLKGLKGDAALNASVWEKMGGETHVIASPRDLKRHESALRHSSVIVDAIFGTGLSLPVEGLYAKVIGLINSFDKKVIAVDIPSGLDASSGAVLGCAVKAGITVTMALNKIGLLLYPGRNYSGMVAVADIGIPRSLIDSERIRWNAACPELIRSMMRPRRAD
ncbi:MAG: NAD(P)H-hydrate epimerase [Deltaproteobacteria bacterium]|nr:NAD(P)H-hydrate epimerase [Deltaproteobacteria bacterium]